ncbi:MAG: cysteine--tRNA ligase [Bacteroidales bacterium]|nr:cysteine--tRNA ligase [Bacteroidales bacterium]
MNIKFYNTLTKTKEDFQSIEPDWVRLYTCGPTVYNYAHIGNLRTYINEDLLRRTLEYFGYKVKHVMNITDVGHLESDADTGEDKMMLGAQREHKTVWEVARFYEDVFFKDCAELNISPPNIKCRATDHISDIINFIHKLDEKGYVYEVDGNVYFDISKFPRYGQLINFDKIKHQRIARVETDSRKKNNEDFVLWFSISKFQNQIMQWDSPWGKGFPGWHIECSVMAIKYLGEQLDIHCGGIDHIPIHHTNEIAQSEGYLGHKWCNTWMHGEFLVTDKEKMSKSKDNFLDLRELKNKQYTPLEYRYYCLNTHYRRQLNFGFDNMDSTSAAFRSLQNTIQDWNDNPSDTDVESSLYNAYLKDFKSVIADDLNIPLAVQLLWKLVGDKKISKNEKLRLTLQFDKVFGLGLESIVNVGLPDELLSLIKERELLRKANRWEEADQVRAKIADLGYGIKDTSGDTKWFKIIR